MMIHSHPTTVTKDQWRNHPPSSSHDHPILLTNKSNKEEEVDEDVNVELTGLAGVTVADKDEEVEEEVEEEEEDLYIAVPLLPDHDTGHPEEDEEEDGKMKTTKKDSLSSSKKDNDDDDNDDDGSNGGWTLRRVALDLSLYMNMIITCIKLFAYLRTWSLSVLAALLDSVLDVVGQGVLYYTEKHSTMHRSTSVYPAGSARLEPIGILICAALMAMTSFEVLKESITSLIYQINPLESMTLQEERYSFWSMVLIVVVKLLLLVLCQKASRRPSYSGQTSADPILEALAQDHRNDCLSNSVAAIALMCALYAPNLWIVDPIGAMIISVYILYTWYHTAKEQIEQLTGKSAPPELIDELFALAQQFDPRILLVDTIRVYHFGPKFLVELEVVMAQSTPLRESHDLGMALQYEIERREEVERCFVHIDYETRDYDEHVISKIPHLLEQHCQKP